MDRPLFGNFFWPSLIKDVCVKDNVHSSDHLPLQVSISDIVIDKQNFNETNTGTSYINWSKASTADVELYSNKCEDLLNKITVPLETVICKNVNCEKAEHISDIKFLYDKILKCMLIASKPLASVKKSVKHQTKGWNMF